MFATVYIDSLERRIYVKGYGDRFKEFFKENLENLGFTVESESEEVIITVSPQFNNIKEVLEIANKIDEDIRSEWCKTMGGHSFQLGISIEVDENNEKFIRAICYKCGLIRKIYINSEKLNTTQ
ncbi:MAG: hypothetical protein QXY40_06020 [Candidatus Methanomethylicia archaeon]